MLQYILGELPPSLNFEAGGCQFDIIVDDGLLEDILGGEGGGDEISDFDGVVDLDLALGEELEEEVGVELVEGGVHGGHGIEGLPELAFGEGGIFAVF